MSPSAVTPPEHVFKMARPQGLLRRGTRWYSNFKVPPDLVAAFGKESIWESLQAPAYKEACRKIAYERARWVAKFDNERRKIAGHARSPRREKRLLTSLSDQEAFEMALSYLAARERRFRDWRLTEGRKLPPSEIEELQSQVAEDASFYADGGEFYSAPDGTAEVKRFLESEGLECVETSPAFMKLRPQTSATFRPLSASLMIATIWLSVNRLFFISSVL